MKCERQSAPIIVLLLIIIFLSASCLKSDGETVSTVEDTKAHYKVTFIELGSVNCIPCKMMQPVIQQIRENFSDVVNVIFYDVWTEEDAHYASDYGVQAIPTQVFLDVNGEEYFRHIGFFAYDDVVAILQRKIEKN